MQLKIMNPEKTSLEQKLATVYRERSVTKKGISGIQKEEGEMLQEEEGMQAEQEGPIAVESERRACYEREEKGKADRDVRIRGWLCPGVTATEARFRRTGDISFEG